MISDRTSFKLSKPLLFIHSLWLNQQSSVKTAYICVHIIVHNHLYYNNRTVCLRHERDTQATIAQSATEATSVQSTIHRRAAHYTQYGRTILTVCRLPVIQYCSDVLYRGQE